MKCEFCGFEFNESENFCSKCGSVQLSVRIMAERANRLWLGGLVAGLLIVVFGMVGFWWLMDIYSNTLYESVKGGYSFSDGIQSEEDAWHFLVFCSYPMCFLALFIAVGFSVLLGASMFKYLFGRN